MRTEIGEYAYFRSREVVAPYDLKSYFVEKELEIFNLSLIRDIAGNIKLEEILFVRSKD